VNDVYVNGQLVNTSADSVFISDKIEERTVCSFTVIDLDNVYDFKKGIPVNINSNLAWGEANVTWGEADISWGDESLYFSGWIDKAIKTEPDNGIFYWNIYCIDSHYLADKRIIAKAYANTRVGDIVTDIFETYLEEEGVTLGTIEDGSIAIEAVFNYIPITDALNSLAEKSGFWWRIDHNRVLHFRSRSGNVAPYELSSGEVTIIKGSIDVENSNSQYRNKQYVRGAKDITDPQAEIRLGDGENQTFTVGYPIAKVPTVEIDVGAGYISQTIGIRGLEEGKDWYWARGDNTITQDSGGDILASTDTIKITYQGEFDVVVVTLNQDEILDTQTTETIGTGIVEDVFDDRSLTGRESAFDVANGKLKKYGQLSKVVRLTVIEKGFEPGQIATVNLPKYGIHNEEFLITKIDTFTEDKGKIIYYSIEAVKGVNNQSWANFFYNIAKQGREFVIRENISEQQVLVTLEEFTKDWEQTEDPNIFKSTIASETTFPSVSTYPMFKEVDRVKYIAWYVGGVEADRKLVAKRINSEDEIFTLSYLSPLDANVEISHIGWFGGINATLSTGTGVEVDKQVYIKSKTELESVQIEKTDTNIDSIVAEGLELTPEFLNQREQDIFNLVDYAETQTATLIAFSL